ncbi:hypothetical protein Tco_0896087 [Tanacetum coccineum]
MQLQQEVFPNDESCVNQNAVEIQKYFEIIDLKARLQDKDTTICKLRDTIKSLSKNTKEENVNPDKCDLEPINKELKNSVAKLLSENERLCNEINSVKQVFKDQFDSIKQTRVRHKEQCDSLINKLNLKSVENEDLKAQIQDKVFVITSLKNDLRKLKGKEIVENVVHTPSATTIAPGMFKLDLEPLPPRLLQNREVYITYLRNTQEQADILREIVEQAKAKQPLDSELDLACKYATRIQELLVYVHDTCHNAITPSAKKVTIKPMNNVKKVRFAEPLTSSSKIQQVESSNTSDSNTPVLSSTRVKCSTSNYGSKPSGNKKNDRISQTPSRNKKNKVEAQPRKVNKVNRVVKPVCDVDVKYSLSNANSEILCATCNKYMFNGVHDKCLLDLVQNGNKRTKSAKKHKKQNIWKPTIMFTSTNVVPPKQTTSHSDEILKTEIKVYSRKPKNVRNIGSSKIAKIGESKNANHSGPKQLGIPAIDISILAKDGLARGIPRLKFQKDHLCSACALGKSKKSSHQPKAKDTNQEKLYLLHMDLCSPDACGFVINGKRYNKTLYDLMQDKKPDLSFFHVFGSLCYLTNDHEDLEVAAPRAEVLYDYLVSTSIDQDAPSTSIPSSQEHEQSLIISQGSTSQGSSSNIRQLHTPFEHLGRWTKDNPIANMIGDPSRSISTRKQLETDAMWCYFDAFLTLVEPNNFKQAMTEPSWIDAMQEEIHEFKRLEV